MMKRIVCISIVWISVICGDYKVTPYISYRSQGQDSARELVGLTQYINRPSNCYYGVWSGTLAYTRSFRPNRIADMLFGSDLRTPTLSALDITGSGVSQRNTEKDWLADYAGLPRDFNSTVRFEPVILNTILDLYWYFALNNAKPGLYATVHIPIAYTKWDLNYFEAVNKEGIANQPPGYFNEIVTGDNIGVNRTDLLANFTDFVFRELAPDLGDQVTFCPLRVAKMSPDFYRCDKNRTALADIQAVLGWNFILNKWSHLGAGIRTVIPTGTRPKGQFIFEPIVGNGHHWELGMQLWGHHTFYVSENEEKQWMLYFLADITHLFNAKQCRVFDLLCKPNSRWMLAEQMTTQVEHLQSALLPDDVAPENLSTPSAQFASRYTPVANLTQHSVKVTSQIQIDATIMLSYMHKNFNMDFGYNGWYRSHEIITKTKNSCTLDNQLWALKGDAYVFGFTSDFNPLVASNIPVALSATESKATIHAGTNNFVGLDGDMGGIDGIRPTRNPGIDNPFFAAADFNNELTTLNDRTTSANGLQTNTSNNPIFISEEQIDLCADQSTGCSNKFFIYFNHLWSDTPCTKPIPFIGAGLELEFGCKEYAISQWGLWLKGGISFN